MSGWQTKSSKIVYENPWMIVHEDQVIRPDGTDGMYGYVDSKSDAVYIVAVDDKQNTYITYQFRYPLKRNSWECPAGRCDGDEPETAARRELLEETGVQAKTLRHIATRQVANGISTFREHTFLATDLTETDAELDPADGILEAKKLPLESVIAMIQRGEITCSQSIASFFMVREFLRQEKQV